jgi:sporulation protein YlmC with PRC-barrel domain
MVGQVEDFLVDVRRWRIRSVVVSARNILGTRHILLSPALLGAADEAKRRIATRLTGGQIRRRPDVHIAGDGPRRVHCERIDTPGWETYWSVVGSGGTDVIPCGITMAAMRREHAAVLWGADLLSAVGLLGSRVVGRCESLGWLQDLVIDLGRSCVAGLVVRPKGASADRDALVPAQMTRGVDAARSRIRLALALDQLGSFTASA